MVSTPAKTPKKSSRRSHIRIAILDQDSAVCNYLQRILADRFTVSLFSGTEELLRSLRDSAAPDLLLMDWHIAENGSQERSLGLLTELRASQPLLPVIILSCSAELKEVIAVTRLGASSVILKPFRKADIDSAVQECLRVVGKQPASAEDTVHEIPLDKNTSFVAASKCMHQIESQCRLVAGADIPVLILGESGTGKEVATLLIHKLSARGQRHFMKVNCAAMPADLLESELFGYEQGAFTGAVKAKPGKFEICNHGTIFLDEIGEMPAVLQAKLLQVLQDGIFSRLGSRSSVQVDVRVIAATNIDMKAAIAQKTFREDLYYRLNGFTLKMPPLRERPEEIPILANYFMQKVAAKFERAPLPISPELMHALNRHPWPGNLRELENTIKRYIILADEQAILDELMPANEKLLDLGEYYGGDGNLKHLVRNLKGGAESAAIARTLEGTGWNRKAAASELQISYKALLYKIKQYNLLPPRHQLRPVLMREA
jgi:DNA-binding NtrC family response regulator